MTPHQTSPEASDVAAPEPVLSTLNKDGSRRWLRPKPSRGRFLNGRRVVGYLLIVLFTALPYIRIGGKPAVLLDLPHREFTLFGTTFLPTDTLLLALLVVTIFVSIFLVTALFGRLWCGWACPQTVYLELLYRPIERLFEGRRYRTGGKAQVPGWRIAAKYATFLAISLVLAHTFLAYFVGIDALLEWMRRSPLEHPTGFVIVAFVTGAMMFDFCFFREQVCTLMCPYGRMQSVMLDRSSLIIGYDEKRGEPRGRKRKDEDAAVGDCIDCKLCVVTCPTGIDIRQGLQMECVGCAQCIDACDEVMEKIGRPRGLIRYSSQEAMQGAAVHLLRGRTIIYPLMLVGLVTALVLVLAGREPATIEFLRSRNTTWRLRDDGMVMNEVLVKITNRADDVRTYDIVLADDDGTITTSDLPVAVEGRGSASVTLRLALPRDRFTRGSAEFELQVTDDDGWSGTRLHTVPGPLFGGGAEAAP